jgi:hypothetical protein
VLNVEIHYVAHIQIHLIDCVYSHFFKSFSLFHFSPAENIFRVKPLSTAKVRPFIRFFTYWSKSWCVNTAVRRKTTAVLFKNNFRKQSQSTSLTLNTGGLDNVSIDDQNAHFQRKNGAQVKNDRFQDTNDSTK